MTRWRVLLRTGLIIVTCAFPLAYAAADAAEITFWKSVSDSKNSAELEAYLELYPDGKFAPLAKIRLEKLRQTEKPEEETSAAPEAASGSAGKAPQQQPEPADSAAKAETPRYSELTLDVSLKPAENDPEKGRIGIGMLAIPDAVAGALGFPSPAKVLILRVVDGSGGEAAGVKRGDIVRRLDGAEMQNVGAVVEAVNRKSPGETVKLDIIRPDFDPAELDKRLTSLARENADTAAAIFPGDLHQYGVWVEKDETKALALYRSAARTGGTDVAKTLGWRYGGLARASAETDPRLSKKYERWAHEFNRIAADRGDAGAMFSVALDYALGMGVAKSESEDLAWSKKAAGTGHARAAERVASHYHDEEEFPLAISWGERALALGDASAHHILASSFRRAAPPQRDYDRSAEHELKYLAHLLTLSTGQKSVRTWIEFQKDYPRDWIKALQRLLKRRGVYDGAIDGLHGPNTERAILEAAEAIELPPAMALSRKRVPGGGVRVADTENGTSKLAVNQGDAIVEVARQPVSTPRQVQTQLRKQKQAGRRSVTVLLKRGDNKRFVEIPLNTIVTVRGPIDDGDAAGQPATQPPAAPDSEGASPDGLGDLGDLGDLRSLD